MALIPYVDPEQAPNEVRDLLEVLPDLHVFRLVGQAPTLFGPWLALGAAILANLELDPLLRELAILQVASTLDCEYERLQHATIAAGVGATSEHVAMLGSPSSGRDHDEMNRIFTPLQRAVVDFTDQVVAPGAVPEVDVIALREHLSDRCIVELLLVIGHYSAIATVAETVRLDLDEPADMAVVELASTATAPTAP
jgi:4-carboxymuconolactone decarboxylase